MHFVSLIIFWDNYKTDTYLGFLDTEHKDHLLVHVQRRSLALLLEVELVLASVIPTILALATISPPSSLPPFPRLASVVPKIVFRKLLHPHARLCLQRGVPLRSCPQHRVRVPVLAVPVADPLPGVKARGSHHP